MNRKRNRGCVVPLMVIGCCLSGWVAQGALNVLEFSGDNSYIDLDRPGTLHMAEDAPFTIEGWMKLNSTSSRDMLYSRRASRGSGDYTYMFGFIDGNKMSAYIGHGGDPNTTWREISLSPVLETERWYHLAFSFDGSNLVYYLDGVAVGTNDFRYSDHEGYQVMIGGYHDSSDIDGFKSDVRVWDHARGQTQIQDFMNYRLTGSEAGLLGYWPLNEGAGSEVYDGTVNAVTGTLINAAWALDGDLIVGNALPQGVLPSLPFTLADQQTGSEKFTNSNEVDIVDFPVPYGYNQFQITESGATNALGPWASTSAIPAVIEFTQPSADSNITLYAWFTNETEAVTLRRAEGGIYYTGVPPEPSLSATYSRQLVPGSPVQVLPSEIDDGSTGGEAGGVPMQIHAMSLNIVAGPDTDATPEEPYITVSELGDYTLSLTVVNEAGNVATSTVTCTLTIEEFAGHFTWTGAGDGVDWHDPFNWSATAVPIAGEPVVISNSASVWLTNSTAALGSLWLTNATLTMANWDTVLEANTVTVDAGGVITHDGPFTDAGPSNRIHIVCVDLYLAEDGVLDADLKGFQGGNTSRGGWGPGGGSYTHVEIAAPGAGHGGHGGAAVLMRSVTMGLYALPPSHGDAVHPEDPGSGGGSSNNAHGGHGGGAIRVQATGEIRIDGLVTANGGNGTDRSSRATGGGAGGSILLMAETLTGTTGILQADGGTGGYSGDWGMRVGGGGAGGRIAVHVDSAAQAMIPRPTLRYSAARGATAFPRHPRKYWWQADWGTLYFNDFEQLLNLDSSDPGIRGYIVAPDLESFTLNEINLSGDNVLGFESTNLTLTVSGDIDLAENTGLITRYPLNLIVGGSFNNSGTVRFHDAATINVAGDLVVTGTNGWMSVNEAVMLVNGDLTVRDESHLRVFAAATNGVAPLYGGSVEVDGDLTIETGARLHPYSAVWNGGAVRIRCRNLIVDATAAIDADIKGFAAATGPGRTAYSGTTSGGSGGAGYGGEGGDAASGFSGGPTYGDGLFPFDSGSGAGNTQRAYGGSGGGVIWIDADKNIQVDGILTAIGQKGGSGGGSRYGGGGSGGSILLFCRRLRGSGMLTAGGGDGHDDGTTAAGGGGGGRIAVWYGVDRDQRQPLLDDPDDPNVAHRIMEPAGAMHVAGPDAAAPGGLGHENGEEGTVVFVHLLDPFGTLLMIR